MALALPPSPALTYRHLQAVYVPLALSWLMMAAEMPICTRFVNLLPNNHVQIAALLVLFSIALFIESPVIDLLATSTTLAQGRQSYGAIRKFTVQLMALCGGVHLLVAVTPLFDFVLKTVLSQSPEVTEAVRIPMLIMVPWSPAIGWRRHVQGLLIRNGVTRPIGLGTLVRVSTIFIVSFAGFLSKRMPGAQVAALALCCSVIVEALFIQFAASRVLRTVAWHDEDAQHLRFKRLLSFHLPLTFSTMVMLTAMPLVAKSLAFAPDHLLAMNSWQVSMTLAFLIRTMTFALPEVVIANWRPGQAARLLTKFCAVVGCGLSVLMVVFGVLGIDRLFFENVTHADSDVASGAHLAFLACSLMPILTAMTSYFKGVLTAKKATSTRVWATLGSIIVLAVVLGYGVQTHWNGVFVAAAAITASQATELAVLAFFAWKQAQDTALTEAAQ